MEWPTPPAYCAADPAAIMVAARSIGDWQDRRDRASGAQARHLAAMGSPLGPSREYMAITHAAYLEQRMLWREAFRLRDLLDTPAWMGGFRP